MRQTNNYIGKVYDRKCGCRYVVKNMCVEANDVDLSDSRVLVNMEVIDFCDKTHHEGIDINHFDVELGKFKEYTISSYSTPEFNLDTIGSMEYRAKYLESLTKEEVDELKETW